MTAESVYPACSLHPSPIHSATQFTFSHPLYSYQYTAEPEKNEPRFKSFDAFLQDNGYSIGDLALKQSYRPVEIQRGCMNKLPVGITIKHQKYRHVDHIEFMNVEEMKNFANYWIDTLEMAEQRAGWLYGYYIEDSHYPLGIRAVCEAIYEPPQRSFMEYSELLSDPFLNTVDRIANKLGLERIGYIFTHLPRENVMTPKDIIDAAKRQLDTAKDIHYTGYPVSTHVTCTMCPDGEGKPVLNAFMASDSAMALLRDGMFSEEQNDIKMVEIRKASSSFEILPQIFESGKEVSSFDSDWLIVRVNDSAPIHPMPFFKHTGFPRENREVSTDVNIWKYTNTPCDFHLLLYIANTLDVDTALAVCDSILKGEEVDGLIWDLLGGMQNE
ncbi:hypothetical protein BEWA_023660 [Theileria equi strain WA]|uniref:Uncharacterized protein n=1 Tax=Theileria equi strain WA TaxID=1537102 RepID=L0AV79_THEEQ|nr:hypothetical protein BEWA_023660 [Theileria equi strain WA]AFZ79517.1 hypothetical protein BEWA_023660 [Theileria equi strain WA]|eukprot:XP_004829183.1 hypothetical protein BEWA_023660 [Theileria equi strain WA]